jgi:hypothetical protein
MNITANIYVENRLDLGSRAKVTAVLNVMKEGKLAYFDGRYPKDTDEEVQKAVSEIKQRFETYLNENGYKGVEIKIFDRRKAVQK